MVITNENVLRPNPLENAVLMSVCNIAIWFRLPLSRLGAPVRPCVYVLESFARFADTSESAVRKPASEDYATRRAHSLTHVGVGSACATYV